ncbi:tail assembly protein [Citrobacter braakii]|uniref:tail assembly protein n=1 Tax=Citrobacter braakii TaxID=57706 RepID=UPI00048A7DAF|nr:tail assembly protein [Citrobacter braakii]EGT0675236.1 tail assembly protein [Citrobacter braakii]
MATPHTLDMATPGMARLCLHGDLQRFGRRFSFSIKTGAEAIYALAIQVPGFRQKMNDGWYQIRIAGQDVDETSVSARLHEPLPDGAIIHIVPRMAGAKSGGLFQVVLGAVAIGAAFFTGGASLAAWGAFSTGLFTAGVSMMLGGVAQMLAPRAKVPSSRQTNNGKQNTYFSSLDNMLAQGNTLPVLYGEMLVGSRTISQEISTRDEGCGGQVVVIGRER